MPLKSLHRPIGFIRTHENIGMKILGAIIAGGQSSRMGGREKAFVMLDGVCLIERLLSRLRFQVDDVVINGNGDASRFAGFKCDVVMDQLIHVTTPLAGIHAVLAHGAALGFDAVVTAPSDSPFIPLDLVEKLIAAGEVTGAAHARSGGQDHYLTGIWTTAMADPMARLIVDHDLRRVQDFASRVKAAKAVWPALPHDPFFNINTAEDLAVAEIMVSGG